MSMKRDGVFLHIVAIFLFASVIAVTFVFPRFMAEYRVEQLEAALKTRIVENVDKVLCDNTRIKSVNQNEYYITIRSWLEQSFALNENELPSLSVESITAETFRYYRVKIKAEYSDGRTQELEMVTERLDVMTVKPNTVYIYDENMRRFFFDMTETDAAAAEMNK